MLSVAEQEVSNAIAKTVMQIAGAKESLIEATRQRLAEQYPFETFNISIREDEHGQFFIDYEKVNA